MTFQQYSDFERTIIKGALPRHRFMGRQGDWQRAGMYSPRLPNIEKSLLMRTEKTTRACRRCWGGKVRAKIHSVGDLVSLVDCPACQGKGIVFG